LIKKLILYSLLFLASLYAYRACLYIGIKKNKAGIYNKYNELFLNTNHYDALFMGSSRAEMHFHPGIFDSITKLNSYNIGISGASPKISLAILKTFCSQHGTPKFLIYNLDYFALKYDSNRLYSFPRYFPYLSNTVLQKELNNIDPRFTSFYYNPIHSLPYSQIDYLSVSLHGWFNVPGKYDTLCYKGYQTAEINTPLKRKIPQPGYSYIHLKNRQYLDSIIQFSKTNHIQLLLVCSPIIDGGTKEVINKQQVINQIQNIAYLNKIEYWDYSNNNISKNHRLFVDNKHMNRNGASLFSTLFSKDFHNKYVKTPF